MATVRMRVSASVSAPHRLVRVVWFALASRQDAVFRVQACSADKHKSAKPKALLEDDLLKAPPVQPKELSAHLNETMEAWADGKGSSVACQRHHLPLEYFVDSEISPPSQLCAICRRGQTVLLAEWCGNGLRLGRTRACHRLHHRYLAPRPRHGIRREIGSVMRLCGATPRRLASCRPSAVPEKPHDDPDRAAARVQDALIRCRQAESLLRRRLIIESMPITRSSLAPLDRCKPAVSSSRRSRAPPQM